MNQWFQIREKSAGEKRLLITWYIYKFFGKKAVYVIAFFVTLFTFIFSGDLRKYSKKYLGIIEPFTSLKPSVLNQFKHIFSYSCVLVDKLEIFSGNFNINKLKFKNQEEENNLFNRINNGKGIFFICSHIGNIEALQSYMTSKEIHHEFGINVFLSSSQSQTFNGFIKSISKEFNIKTFDVEDIGIDTAITLKDNLDKGDIVFIAGDRISENNSSKVIESKLFNHKVDFPLGVFKLAQLMEVPIYFISAVKTKEDNYKILLEEHVFTDLDHLTADYARYLEQVIVMYPFQFYHYYDIFKD